MPLQHHEAEISPQPLHTGALAGSLGWTMESCSRAQTSQSKRTCANIDLANRLIRETVKEETMSESMIMDEDGEHTTGMATLPGAASAHDELSVIWVDAPADGHATSTPSSWVQAPLPCGSWFGSETTIEETNYATADLSHLEASERQQLRNSGVIVYTMQHVDEHGVSQRMEMTFGPSVDGPADLPRGVDSWSTLCSGLSLKEAHYVRESSQRTTWSSWSRSAMDE